MIETVGMASGGARVGGTALGGGVGVNAPAVALTATPFCGSGAEPAYLDLSARSTLSTSSFGATNVPLPGARSSPRT